MMITKQSYQKFALMRVFVFSLSAFIFNTTELKVRLNAGFCVFAFGVYF